MSVEGGQRVEPRDLAVPGDFSSAAFWMVAAAALPGSRVVIEDVGLNPTRIGLVDVLRRYGARVEIEETSAASPASRREPLPSKRTARGSVEIAPAEVPVLIDELPAIAALAANGGEVSVRGAAELRVKESDRIAALVAGFRALGIDADERPDGFVVRGSGSAGWRRGRCPGRPSDGDGVRDRGARRRTAVAGRRSADSVAISYPGFFETLASLVAPA